MVEKFKVYRSKQMRRQNNPEFREIQSQIRGKWYVIGHAKTKTEANKLVRFYNGLQREKNLKFALSEDLEVKK